MFITSWFKAAQTRQKLMSISRTVDMEMVCVCVCVYIYIYIYIRHTYIVHMKMKSENVSHSVMSDFLIPWTVAHQVPHPWNSPGTNTGVGCHSLLKGIFPTQESNLGLLHFRWILYHLRHQGSPLYIYVLHTYTLWILYVDIIYKILEVDSSTCQTLGFYYG